MKYSVKIFIWMILSFTFFSLIAQDEFWITLIEKEGLNVSFIYYTKADNVNNGFVVRLKNNNDYSIQYKFTLIFRSEEKDTTEIVAGTLKPGETSTGSRDNLFFIPFKDQSDIYELGVTDFKAAKFEH